MMFFSTASFAQKSAHNKIYTAPDGTRVNRKLQNGDAITTVITPDGKTRTIVKYKGADGVQKVTLKTEGNINKELGNEEATIISSNKKFASK